MNEQQIKAYDIHQVKAESTQNGWVAQVRGVRLTATGEGDTYNGAVKAALKLYADLFSKSLQVES